MIAKGGVMSKIRYVAYAGAAFITVIAIMAVISLLTRGSEQFARNIEVQVMITDDGFVPEVVSIERGATVVWVNDTTKPRKVGANPYPDGSSLKSLKSGNIAPDDSYSYTFNKSGRFGYADYTNPLAAGSVQVK